MRKFIKNLISEYKDFTLNGRGLDLAAGVVIGAAFASVVAAVTTCVLKPVFAFVGWPFDPEGVKDYLEAAIYWENFTKLIKSIIDFLISALAVFIVLKFVRSTKHSRKNKDETKLIKCPYCFEEISPKATRCPHCTSVLESLENKKLDTSK